MIDPAGIEADIAERGHAVRPILDPAACAEIARLWDDESRFRKRIVMQERAYGRGEYRYLAYPLPERVAALRAAFYAPLAVVANAWRRALGQEGGFPPDLATFLAECHAAGQTRPTPLLLRYGPGDFNCLHQDVYGDRLFPLQVVILLSDPDHDFTGGEFILVEQRPRAQSRAEIVPLRRGKPRSFPCIIDRRGERGGRTG